MADLKIISSFRGWLAGWLLPGLPEWSDPSWRAAAGMGSSGALPTPAESIGIDGIYQSVNLLSDPVTSQPLQLRQTNPDGGSKQVQGTDVARALATWSLVDKEKFIFDTLVNGNGFAAIRYNDRGGVSRLETISAHRISVAVDESGNIWYEIAPDPTINSGAEVLPAADCVHLKYRAHAQHLHVGQSPLITLAPSLEKVVVINRAGASVFRNLSAPSLVLSTPKKLGKDAAKRLRDMWAAAFSGSNQGKTAVLDNELSVQVINRGTATDFQIAELDAVNVKSLSRAFGIPPALLAESGATAYNSSVELIRSFHSLTLKPFARRIADCLSRSLLSDEQLAAGLYVSIDMASLIRGEGKELADYLSVLTNSGVLSPNEGRQMVGLEDVAGGNTLRAPVNVMPIDTWQEYAPGSTAEQAAPADDSIKQIKQKYLSLAKRART